MREKSFVFSPPQLSSPGGVRETVPKSFESSDKNLVSNLRNRGYAIFFGPEDSDIDMRSNPRGAIRREFKEIENRMALFAIQTAYGAEGPSANIHYAVSIGAFVLIGHTRELPLEGRAEAFVKTGAAEEIIVPFSSYEHFDSKFQSGS